MRINSQTRRIDSTPVEGSRKCTKCERAKPLKFFRWLPGTARYSSWCKQCVRIGIGLSLEDPDVKAARDAYEATPRRKEMKRVVDANRNREKLKQSRVAWRHSPRGLIMERISGARKRLRRADTDERRAVIQALIDRHTAELAALEAWDDDD